MPTFTHDVCVIGGGGHVGLPLALVFADAGLKTVIYDVNQATVAKIRAGVMPFAEHGGQELLDRALARKTLTVDDSPQHLADCRFLVLIIGTPVDEHLNPSFTGIHRALEGCAQYLRDGQTLVLRSTVFPGITRHVERFLADRGLNIPVAFCPERVAQGYSIKEFRELPQIIGATDRATFDAVKELFGRFTPEFIEMTPMEAELCKLMTNAWRYIQFATVNQFHMIATKHGLDFDRILHGCRHKYPRMQGVPGPGFAAGPCLVKDTMQLAAFSQNTFALGHAAMLINEGMPAHLVELAKREVDLQNKVTGILGMAFKPNSDDPRDALSYKLRKLLTLESKQVLCTDPHVTTDVSLVPLERVLKEADVLFMGVPHKEYKSLKPRDGQLVIDLWNSLPKDCA
jgi:UDP-N-acetyl-D-mannosaminuronic acid dehydrogenase